MMVRGKPTTVSSMFIGLIEVQFSEIIRNLNKNNEFEIINETKGSKGKCVMLASNFNENKDKICMNLKFDNLKKINQ